MNDEKLKRGRGRPAKSTLADPENISDYNLALFIQEKNSEPEIFSPLSGNGSQWSNKKGETAELTGTFRINREKKYDADKRVALHYSLSNTLFELISEGKYATAQLLAWIIWRMFCKNSSDIKNALDYIKIQNVCSDTVKLTKSLSSAITDLEIKKIVQRTKDKTILFVSIQLLSKGQRGWALDEIKAVKKEKNEFNLNSSEDGIIIGFSKKNRSRSHLKKPAPPFCKRRSSKNNEPAYTKSKKYGLRVQKAA